MDSEEMGPVELQPGRWNNLEWFYGKVPETIAVFRAPEGVQLKVRYGWGRFGVNTQQQTTDGTTPKRLRVKGWVGRARMAAKVRRPSLLTWVRLVDGPEPLPPLDDGAGARRR